jgi:hypothetical protein
VLPSGKHDLAAVHSGAPRAEERSQSLINP